MTSILQVNLRFFQTTFWNNIDLGSTQAGADPAWRSMLVTRWGLEAGREFLRQESRKVALVTFLSRRDLN